jgi:hypothetical protein
LAEVSLGIVLLVVVVRGLPTGHLVAHASGHDPAATA